MRWCAALALILAACEGSGRPEGATTSTTGGTSGGATTAGTSGGGGGGDDGGVLVHPGGGTTGGDPNCGVQNFMLAHGTIPELLIVQDRSGSMDWDPDGNLLSGTKDPQSRWMQIVTALEQVVQKTSTIMWGLEMFPDANADPFSSDGCEVATSLDVPVGANTGMAITTALDQTGPDGSTPTTAAIQAAVKYFTSGVDSDGHPKYLLLATDGEPNCGSSFDDNAAAEKAVADAAAIGIHTFVVGIGNSSDDDAVLTQMAKNGMEPNPTAGQKPYYQVSSTQALVDVLTTIAGQLVSCSYALQTPPTSPDLVTIQSGTKTIPHDTTHVNGWDYGPGDMSIIFYGSSCNNLQNGITTQVSAVYGCPPVS